MLGEGLGGFMHGFLVAFWIVRKGKVNEHAPLERTKGKTIASRLGARFGN